VADELTLGLAFMTGLAGAGHCWAMCGGLVGGLFLGCGRCAGARGHLGYHLGRVLGYTGIGALAAALGQALVLTGDVGQGQGVLYVLAGLAVAGAGAWSWFFPSPSGRGAGVRVKRLLAGDADVGNAARSPSPPAPAPRPTAGAASPAGFGGARPASRNPAFAPPGEGGKTWPDRLRPLLPAPSFLAAGLINALMPCALVYSLAVKAMTAPSVAQGAAWLFAFGLGTVPAMAAAGALAHGLGAQALVWLRRAAAVLVIALGIQAVLAGAEFFRVMGHL
jgi:sulfite exporter TauE/SafE